MAGSAAQLRLTKREIGPHEVVFGSIWLGPGSGTEKGNGNHPDLGQRNANDAIEAAALAGIVEFDTAPWYGAGAAEERLGGALRVLHEKHPNISVKVTTKVGRLFMEPVSEGSVNDEVNGPSYKPALAGFDNPDRPPLFSRICKNDYTAKGSRESHAHSLNRMGLAKVHGLRIHDPNDNSNNNRKSTSSSSFVDEVSIATDVKDGSCQHLRRMRDDTGEIDHVGIGMNCTEEDHMGSPSDFLRLLRESPANTFDSALMAGGWNLLNQTGLDCIKECQNRGISVHIAGVFSSGYLVDESKPYAYVNSFSEQIVQLKNQWIRLADEYQVSLPALAIAFSALPACVSRVVLGMATADEVRQNLSWVEESNRVPVTLWVEAKNRGLISVDVPILENI
mmetsp:Transcript_57/g.99  ORF Transcript_57/g.99 Transcript_57/m.99 type:complete len:393 (+) Transcript_57:122-1300(+)